ncbi:hypothetical protein GCM10023350_15690 [Nocardioides endophyticus]|uniref:Uncharacterized protein n=2 Tax=Nocardioides endophyticus TaxID=1353775 RepID=A0ABP8YN29_9ACTN
MPDPRALMVTTGEGETFVLGSTMRGCSPVSIGGTDRGAEDVLAPLAPSR